MFSGRPKFSFLLKISAIASIKRFLPALKLINPPITEYSLSDSSISATIAFAIAGGAILADRARDETLTAKSPKSGFLGFSTISVFGMYSVICPSFLFEIAFSSAFSSLFKK